MNIYVSHLSWGTTNETLKNLFAQYGEVSSANVITDRETGRSRGFGFVEMTSDEDGQKAIDALNGTQFEGQTINVNVARPREDRPQGGRGGFGHSNGGYGHSNGGYNRGGNGGYGRGNGGYGRDNGDDRGGRY
jgi:RNA recognition motif-containing protein